MLGSLAYVVPESFAPVIQLNIMTERNRKYNDDVDDDDDYEKARKDLFKFFKKYSRRSS